MKIPKHFFHDRAVLAFVGINTVLALFSLMYIFFGVLQSVNTTQIIQHRDIFSARASADTSGSITEFRYYALFVLIQYVFGLLLSIRVYVHRRVLSVAILAAVSYLTILTIVVVNLLHLQRG